MLCRLEHENGVKAHWTLSSIHSLTLLPRVNVVKIRNIFNHKIKLRISFILDTLTINYDN